MKNILGIECAGASCSVAVLSGDEKRAFVSVTLPSGYPEVLLPMIEDCIRQSGLTYNDMDLIAAGAGAGSFTGVRIGLASAQGIALVTGAQVVGISNFAASAFMVSADERKDCTALVAVLEPRREDFYVQFFASDLTALGSPLAAYAQDIVLPSGKVIIVGDAAARFAKTKNISAADSAYIVRTDCVPDAEVIARYTAFLDRTKAPLPPPVALYVSPAHVTA